MSVNRREDKNDASSSDESGSSYETSDDDDASDDSDDDEGIAQQKSEQAFNSLMFKMMLRSQKKAPITQESANILLTRAGQGERHANFLPWLGKSRSIELGVCSAKIYRSLVYKDKAIASLAADVSEDMKREMKQLDAQFRRRAGDPAADIAHEVRRAHEESKLRFARPQVHLSAAERRRKVRAVPAAPAPPGVAEKPWYAVLASKGNEAFFDYEGEWEGGYMDGQGTFHYADGGTYTGTWSKGKPHGPGIATYGTGDVYDGHWREGRYYGPGKMTYATGAVYEGYWVKGKRHGQGKITYPNGRYYEGYWQSGFRHGRGKEVARTGFDGKEYSFEGNWKMNAIDGPGTVTRPSGEKEVRAEWNNQGLNDLMEMLEAEAINRFHWKEQDRQALLGPMFNLHLETFVQATRNRIAKERADAKAEEKAERKRAALEKKEAAKKLKDQFRTQMLDELVPDEEGGGGAS